MANSTRICKICGSEYPYCKTELKDGEIFRWQDVACCPEHGSEYFARITASRDECHSSEIISCDVEDDEYDDDEEDFDEDEEEDFDI